MQDKTFITDSRIMPYDLETFVRENPQQNRTLRAIGIVVGPRKDSPQEALEALSHSVPVEKGYQILQAKVHETRPSIPFINPPMFYWTGVAYTQK